MLKKIGIFAVLVLIAMPSMAQRKKSKSKKEGIVKHELGINTSTLIRRIFTLNNVSTDYSIKYRYNFNKSTAVQFGLGGFFSDAEREAEVGNVTNNSSLVFNSKLGLVFNLEFNERWKSYLGGEAVFGINNSRRDQSNSGGQIITNTDFTEVGGGPVLGIVFRVNERINLSSELAFHVVYSKSVNDQEFVSFPEFNQSFIEKRYSARSRLPANIYLEIRF